MPGDGHLGMLSELALHCWPSKKAEVQKDLQPYWSFKDEIPIIDGIAVKGRRTIVPSALQGEALEQLQFNHMGIGITRLLAFESICWVNMNAYIVEAM